MDRINARGTLLVKCAGNCGLAFWVDCIDPRLPDGPFLCSECDTEACALAEKRLAQDLLPMETV